MTGTVTMLEDDKLTLETDQGSTEVHLGPEWYWDAQGVSLAVGDEVRISGFYEDDTFQVEEVEDLTNGEAVTLRDDTGRPLWAGRGNGQRGRTTEN
jgi:hypothetical protein